MLSKGNMFSMFFLDPLPPRLFEWKPEKLSGFAQVHDDPVAGTAGFQRFGKLFENAIGFIGSPGIVAQFARAFQDLEGGTVDIPRAADRLDGITAGDLFAEIILEGQGADV